MDNDFQKSVFDRTLLTALFVGICTTLLTIFYDIFFVEILKFPLSAIINVASLIFCITLLFLVIGLVYYAFITSFKHGNAFFIVLFILLTAFLVWKAEGVNRADNYTVNMQFRSLLTGIIIIVGILASLAIPFLFHNKKFEKYVL